MTPCNLIIFGYPVILLFMIFLDTLYHRFKLFLIGLTHCTVVIFLYFMVWTVEILYSRYTLLFDGVYTLYCRYTPLFDGVDTLYCR